MRDSKKSLDDNTSFSRGGVPQVRYLDHDITAPKIKKVSGTESCNNDSSSVQKAIECSNKERKISDSTNYRNSLKHSLERKRSEKRSTRSKYSHGGILKTRSWVILSAVISVILMTSVYATIGSHAELTRMMNDMSALSSNNASYRSQVARDNTAPTITGVQDIVSEATSQLSQVSLTAPTVTDDVDPTPTLTNDAPSSGFPLGTNAVTWTAKDDGGNTATALQKVTLIDTTPPVIIAPADLSVYVDSSTSYYIHAALGVAAVTDLVDRSPYVTNNAPSQFSAGVTTVTWTAVDASGNSATDTQLVSVMVIEATSSSSGSGTSGTLSGTSSSTTTQDTSSSSITSTSSSSSSTTTQTYTSSSGGSSGGKGGGGGGGGGSGKSTGSGSGGTRVDTTPPKIFKPAKIIAEATGKLTVIQLAAPKVTDNTDPNPTVTNNAPVGGFPLGTTIVTWTAKDASGNTSTADQQVTIKDTTAPSIVAPPNVAAEAKSSLTLVSLGTPKVSDLVDPSPHVSNDAPANGFWVGSTNVTWTAVDASGNIAKAVQTVTIVDTKPPVIVAPADITAYTASASNPITISLGQAYVNDTADKSPTVTNNAPASFSVGTTTVTWTARDASGNIASDTQKISVILLDSSGSTADNTPPTITAPPDLKVNSTGQLTKVQLGTPIVSDNVDPNPTVTNNAAANGFPVGKTIVTWTAKDASGNSASDTQIVAVVQVQNSNTTTTGSTDINPPTIVAPPDVTAKATGSLTPVALGTPTVTDKEDPSPKVTNNAPSAGFPVGKTTVTWTATDAAGNSATDTQLVTIQNPSTYYIIPSINGTKPTKVTYGSTVNTVCDSGCTHTTIRAAIDGLPATGGKVILKGPKTYLPASSIILRSNLVLQFEQGAAIKYSGTGPAIYGKSINNVMIINPVISVSTTGDALYLESVNTIIVDGGSISGVKSSSNAAFKCNNCKNIVVQNGSYSSFARPIHIGTFAPAGCTVQICKLTGDTRNVWLVGNEIFNSNIECVHLNYSYDVHANDNNIRDCVGNGLDVGFNAGVEARNNTIYNAGWGTKTDSQGIHTDSTTTVVLVGNKVDFSGTQGIQICGSDKNYVIGNTVSRSGRLVDATFYPGHGTGINVIPCSTMIAEYTVIDKNTVTDSNEGYGIYIANNSKPSYLTNNTLLNNEKGAYKDDSYSATISSNLTYIIT